MLKPQTTIIICHQMKKILLKKIQKYGRLYQNLYVKKIDTYVDNTYS